MDVTVTSGNATFGSESVEHTEVLGAALGGVLSPGDIVGLVGGLGAGKTCFVRGVARGAGVADEGLVASPTFTLINEYPGAVVSLAHVDLYRLGDASELHEIGVEEYYHGPFASLVEWIDRFAEVAPDERLDLRFVVTGDDSRRLEATAYGERAAALLRRWQAAAADGAGAESVGAESVGTESVGTEQREEQP